MDTSLLHLDHLLGHHHGHIGWCRAADPAPQAQFGELPPAPGRTCWPCAPRRLSRYTPLPVASETRGQSAQTLVQAVMAQLVRPERYSRGEPLLPPEAAPQLQRHQVSEYERHSLVCPVCGAGRHAEWPAAARARGFGLEVQAMTPRCAGAFHPARRTPQGVLEELFRVFMSWGAVAHLEQVSVQVLVVPVTAIGKVGATTATS